MTTPANWRGSFQSKYIEVTVAIESFEEWDIRPGDEFRFEKSPGSAADAVFIALYLGNAIVTRRFDNLLLYPEHTPVIANWHGQYRTDAFSTTVGELIKKRNAFFGRPNHTLSEQIKQKEANSKGWTIDWHRPCEGCDKRFKRKQRKQRFCSAICREIYKARQRKTQEHQP